MSGRRSYLGARRGALLLEVMLALALFVSGGLAILALVRQSVGAFEHTRQTQRAVNIARSAMAKIEAGLADPAMLVGPVAMWDGRAEAMSAGAIDSMGSAGLAPTTSALDVDDLWELEIDSEPSQFAGLNTVSVRALRHAAPGSDRITASYSLVQLVRLGTRAEDTTGDQGDLFDAATRGAREGGPP
jgi:Tfp pilus assembly protein PilV